MRDIKFRGWHSTQKKMYSAEQMANDQLTLLPTGEFINVNGRSTSLSMIYPKDKFIPLQCTGLKDKNGKEIYEGDLVRQKQKFADGYQIFLIAWGHIGWFPELKARKLEKMMHKIEGENDADWEQFEVIGNIYENPELLKGEDSE
jgi:hypothetical protein